MTNNPYRVAAKVPEYPAQEKYPNEHRFSLIKPQLEVNPLCACCGYEEDLYPENSFGVYDWCGRCINHYQEDLEWLGITTIYTPMVWFIPDYLYPLNTFKYANPFFPGKYDPRDVRAILSNFIEAHHIPLTQYWRRELAALRTEVDKINNRQKSKPSGLKSILSSMLNQIITAYLDVKGIVRR